MCGTMNALAEASTGQPIGNMIRLSPHVATAALPATCGELVQGTLDDVPCLVSCPITMWSQAQVILTNGAEWQMPADAEKTARAIRAGLQARGRPKQGGLLRLVSLVPRGRGYGSSTADIGAALYALGMALARPFTAEEVARLAVSIEPSDSTMFPGFTLFDHRRATFHEYLGPAPALGVIVLDPGGEVDTFLFNRCDHRAKLRSLAPLHREAFSLLRDGVRRGDLEAIGQAATLSSTAHETILHNPLLETALAIARDIHALGVCRAHSGTILGLLVDARQIDAASALAYVGRRLKGMAAIAWYTLTDGGARPAHIGMHPQQEESFDAQ